MSCSQSTEVVALHDSLEALADPANAEESQPSRPQTIGNNKT